MSTKHPGLRLSLAGGGLFLVGMAGLLFLPPVLYFSAILIGATLVWGGFFWTLLDWYRSTPSPPS